MDKRFELNDSELDSVTGGKITYTWSSADNIGTIGLDENNFMILLDKAAFAEYYKSVQGTMSDGAILKQLLLKGIAKMPEKK